MTLTRKSRDLPPRWVICPDGWNGIPTGRHDVSGERRNRGSGYDLMVQRVPAKLVPREPEIATDLEAIVYHLPE